MQAETLGIILAGGRGRRMGGGNKVLVPLAGRPLLAHVVDRLAPQVAAMAISANGDPACFAAFGLPVLPDTVPGLPGPLAGVLAGMEAARARRLTHVLTVPGDTPFAPRDLAARLAEAGSHDAFPVVTAASHGRRHHAVALWSVALEGRLAGALAQGERRVGAFAATVGCAVADFGTATPDPFFNVNTPADLQAAAKLRPPDAD